MAQGSFILVPGKSAWRIGAAGGSIVEVPVAEDASAGEIAAAAAGAIRRQGYVGQGILLALPSAWCLAASISLEGLPRGDREAMLYRLEEKLPAAAEAVAADFVLGAGGERALGVCVPNERAAGLVEALEGAGVTVVSISPVALLALQHRGAKGMVTWAEDERVNVFAVESGRLVGWSLVSNDPADAELQKKVLRATHAGLGARGDDTDAIGDSIHATAAAIAPSVLSGRVRPWIELRRGALGAGDALRVHRRPLNALLGAAAILMLGVTAALIYRGWQYDKLADSLDGQLRADFRRDFAGWPEPMNVGVMVASERRKVEAAGAGALPAEARQSALRVMHDVLGKVPRDAAVTVHRATFDDSGVQLEGDAKSQADVEPLVQAARAAGLEVPPAQARKTNSGNWTFVVRGSKSTAGAAAGSEQGRVEP